LKRLARLRRAMGLFDKLRGKQGEAALVEDPVCHMKIDPKGAAGESRHGETYFFCSKGCKAKFDSDPHKYLGAHGH
jgi:P-type Cu+ transporter